MIRNPFLDAIAGAFFALGGPMALFLPQRIFLAMLAAELEPLRVPARVKPPRGPRR